MSKASTAVALFVAVAVAATVARFTIFGDNLSDKEQIKVALKDSIEAGKEGRAGSVIDLLSKEFEVNGMQPGMNQVSKLVREYKPEVEVLQTEPLVSGDVAEIVSPVKLSLKGIPTGFEISNVKFVFQKEQGTTLLIFPSKKWRLRSLELPEDIASQLGELGGGGGLGFGGMSLPGF
jgi:hypothetical protein